MIAYCYANGCIRIHHAMPSGALPIATSRGRKILRDFLDGVSRHGYQRGVLLVPGIPEAPNQKAALDALKRFTKWAAKGAPDGVAFVHSKHRIGSTP